MPAPVRPVCVVVHSVQRDGRLVGELGRGPGAEVDVWAVRRGESLLRVPYSVLRTLVRCGAVPLADLPREAPEPHDDDVRAAYARAAATRRARLAARAEYDAVQHGGQNR